MFEVKDDLTIYATRGDVVFLTVSADDNGNNYIFKQGDILRMKIFEKKDCQCVVMQKDFTVTEDSEFVDITLESKDTRIGKVISKEKPYWYQIELNPETAPQTIIGYTPETGARLFVLLPEGKELGEDLTDEEINIIKQLQDDVNEFISSYEYEMTPDDKADIITEVAKIMELAAMGFTIVTADGYVLTDVDGERISARIGG